MNLPGSHPHPAGSSPMMSDGWEERGKNLQMEESAARTNRIRIMEGKVQHRFVFLSNLHFFCAKTNGRNKASKAFLFRGIGSYVLTFRTSKLFQK